jgi:hypothetical protein
VVSGFELLEHEDILDGDGRLGGEGQEEPNLLRPEGAHLGAIDRNHSGGGPAAQERRRQHRAHGGSMRWPKIGKLAPDRDGHVADVECTGSGRLGQSASCGARGSPGPGCLCAGPTRS